jgi:hypothetical protein
MFLPVAGIPEKDFKAILTKDQWDRWTRSSEFSNVSNFWTMVDRNHQARVGQKVKVKTKVKVKPIQ